MLKAFWFVFYTEMTLRFRRSQEWLYPLGFFIIVICLFPLAYTPDPVFLQKYLPGCLWLAALLASLLAVENLFHADMEDGHLEQLLLSETPLTVLIYAKLCAHWVATELPLILLTPLIGMMFHLSLHTIFLLCISLLLGTPLLTLIGSLGTALTLGLRQQGMLLSLLMLPLVIPVLIFGVSIIQQGQAGLSIAGPLLFLAGICVLAVTLIPWVIALALGVALDD